MPTIWRKDLFWKRSLLRTCLRPNHAKTLCFCKKKPLVHQSAQHRSTTCLSPVAIQHSEAACRWVLSDHRQPSWCATDPAKPKKCNFYEAVPKIACLELSDGVVLLFIPQQDLTSISSLIILLIHVRCSLCSVKFAIHRMVSPSYWVNLL